MVDFSYLASLEIPNEAKPYSMDIRGEDAILHLLPAAESNKPYWNAVLRYSNDKLKGGKKKTNVDAASVEKNRKIDKQLIARHCLVGWDGIKDTDNNDVPFTKENGLEFLMGLPGHMFDPIKAWAADKDNYIAAAPEQDDDLDLDADADAEPKGAKSLGES